MSVSKASTVLAKRAKQGQLNEDIQLLLTAGFLTSQMPELDPEVFTDKFSDLLQSSGLTVETGIQFMCWLIDQKKLQVQFMEYSEQFLAALKPEPAPVPTPATPAEPATTEEVFPAPPPDPSIPVIQVPVKINTAEFGTVSALLANELESKLTPGEKWNEFTTQPDCKDYGVSKAVISVIRIETGFVLDGYLMKGPICVASAPPGRDMAKPIRIEYAGALFELKLEQDTKLDD